MKRMIFALLVSAILWLGGILVFDFANNQDYAVNPLYQIANLMMAFPVLLLGILNWKRRQLSLSTILIVAMFSFFMCTIHSIDSYQSGLTDSPMEELFRFWSVPIMLALLGTVAIIAFIREPFKIYN